jgi:hypothetical protein
MEEMQELCKSKKEFYPILKNLLQGSFTRTGFKPQRCYILVAYIYWQ